MMLEVNGRHVETDIQGFLQHLNQWDEDFAMEQARKDGLRLYNDHWELIYYFRDYYTENQTNPTMHSLIRDLGCKSKRFHDRKDYEKHIYSLFPCDPVHEICKLAGLPLPPPDT
ncbi:MAG TPA: TusE/DsrC/DsvC family sulfur relay protein [Gammaproteobacteria bacterium]|nr:TusE/DsrC/DsvC family sulfur relay protein [Gammaproteobacteria bacterium]